MASYAVAPSAPIDAIDEPARWGAVYAMSLSSFVLIASEFMPASLLSPIARTLALTEGQAGQAIAVSGLSALVTSLTISPVLGTLDRRLALLGMAALLVASDVVVAFAPGYLAFMAGRALLGVAVGGFRSMAAAVVMRLVPRRSVAKALAILNGGNALATVIAVPLGSFLGSLIGWRCAFICVVPVALAAIVWQASTVPTLAVGTRESVREVFRYYGANATSVAYASYILIRDDTAPHRHPTPPQAG